MKKGAILLFFSLMLTVTLTYAFDLSAFLFQKPKSCAIPQPSVNLSHFFNGKIACFILYDPYREKVVAKYNPTRCAEQLPADSTFKIPLSLMVFDQGIINQQSIFIWDRKDRGLAAWNEDQTPKSWISNSTVWVSQLLTPQLGLNRIHSYLKKFNYGNQDFSGGITHAWLSSSLKISADEELDFLQNLFKRELPVSEQAMDDTLENMYLETSARGWKLYGKTGTGTHQHLTDGWFVGLTTKNNRTYIFVLNFSDLAKPVTSDAGGLRAEALAKTLLSQMNVY